MKNLVINVILIAGFLQRGCTNIHTSVTAEPDRPQELIIAPERDLMAACYEAISRAFPGDSIHSFDGYQKGFDWFHMPMLDKTNFRFTILSWVGEIEGGGKVKGYSYKITTHGTQGLVQARYIDPLIEELNKVFKEREIKTIAAFKLTETTNNKRFESSTGTGFAVSPDGIIITAYHIVDGSSKISVKFENGNWSEVKMIKYSKSNDIAVLKADIQTINHLQLTDTKKLKQADRVFTMGYPVTYVLGVEPKYTEGYVSSLSGIQGEDSLMQVSVPIQPGNSGGPLVNNKGQVVGLITSTAAVNAFYKFTGTLPQNVNWAIKSDYIKLLVDPEFTRPQRGSDDVVEITKKSICFIKTE